MKRFIAIVIGLLNRDRRDERGNPEDLEELADRMVASRYG